MESKTKAMKADVQIEDTPAQDEPVMAVKPNVESVYSAAELVRNHKVFHTSPEIVTVALRLAGKNCATFEEAKTIIEKFKHKEVK